MKIQISHGADPENSSWFIVLPLPNKPSLVSTVTNEMAVKSLLLAGRTVYELDVEPYMLDSDPDNHVIKLVTTE